MHGLIVMHHVVEDVSQDALRAGVAALGAAVGLTDLAAAQDGSQPGQN